MHNLPTQPGIRVNLAELIEMRHRVREVQLFSTPAQRSPLIGLHHSKLRGRGVDFDQVRAYQAGDDVRSIDWRVTARTQEPHTKLFHEERERPIYLLVEQSPRLFFGSGLCFKSVLAAQAASLIGWAALGHNDRIGGLVFGADEQHEIKPRRSKQSLLQLLNRLARANQALSGDSVAEVDRFAQALRRAREVLRPGSLAVVLCDERTLGDSNEQQLTLLARHTDLLLLPLSDPLDHALPAAGLLRFAQRGAQLELDTHDSDLRQAYRAQSEARQARWQRLAQKLGVPLLPVDTLLAVAEEARQQYALQQSALRVLALLDARMDELYAAHYAYAGGVWQQREDYGLFKPEQLALQDSTVLAGNVFVEYGERLPVQPALPRWQALPTAAAMLRLAPALLAAGHAVPAEQALPRYIRDKVAKTTLERAAEKRLPTETITRPP